jgi:hypothetical protein
MIAVQHHAAQEYRDRAINQIDQLLLDSKESARVMALTVHPYLLGVPHRLRYFREALEYICRQPAIVFWTGAQIYDWYLTQSADPGRVDSVVAQ